MPEITCNAFSELEQEVQQEFYEDVESAIVDINECATELEQSVNDEIIDRMFRAIHTVKGNCNMVFLTEFVDATHRLEDLFSSIRSKEIEYHAVYGRLAIHIVNLVELQLKLLIDTGKADGDALLSINQLIDELLTAENADKTSTAEKAILAIEEGHFNIALIVHDAENGQAYSYSNATDSEFFDYISNQNQQNPQRQIFFNICSVLASKLNGLLSNSADEQQLHAAIIFLHLSQHVTPNGDATPLNVQQCIMASGFLSRMSGWSEAADLCLQVMEYIDGSGAPKGLKNDEIMPAAQVITLAFEFAYYISDSSADDYKQSLFSAVKQINNEKDKRYKDRLIQRFNQIIKSDYLTQKMF